MAKSVPGISVIIGGHDHSKMVAQVGGTMITKAGNNAEALGVTQLHFTGSRFVGAQSQIVDVSNFPKAPDLQRFIEATEQNISHELDVPIAHATVALDARRASLTQGENALANFLVDTYRQSFGADMAILVAGDIRAERIIRPGPISMRDIMAMLPYDDPLMKVRVKGAVLRRALEHALRKAGPDATHFIHPSGFRYQYDLSRPVGERITGITVGGAPFDDQRDYTLFIDHYVLTGGDSFDFSEATLLHLPSESIAKAPYVAAQLRGQVIAPMLDGRINGCQQALDPNL